MPIVHDLALSTGQIYLRSRMTYLQLVAAHVAGWKGYHLHDLQ